MIYDRRRALLCYLHPIYPLFDLVQHCAVIPATIVAITVGTGKTGPPTFRLGDQQCIGPPKFLSVVFKNQEISQQVVTRMQDLASEFSQIFRGGRDTPKPSQREAAIHPLPL